MYIHFNIMGLTIDPKLTHIKHIDNTAAKTSKTILVFKELYSANTTILPTYKAVTIPILEYVSTILSPIAPTTKNITK